MMKRFWEWLFHPSIRWYKPQKGKAFMYRYPSPGSSINQQTIKDYRLPYQTSQYNIRYANPTPQQFRNRMSIMSADLPGLTITQKLISGNFLKRGQQKNQEAVKKAKEAYKNYFGFPAQDKIYKNDFNFPLPQNGLRQQFQHAIDVSFHSRRSGKQFNNTMNRKNIDNPQIYEIQSLDLYCDAKFQQNRIQNEYYLDSIINQRVQKGSMGIVKGESSFWKALDNSNDPKNIQKVQTTIKDPKPNNFQLRLNTIEFQKKQDGQVVDLHKK